jgi:hypothetical protein
MEAENNHPMGNERSAGDPGDPCAMVIFGASIVAWNVVAPIQNVWGALEPREYPNYPAGGWGPEEAEELLIKDGRRWYHPPAIRESADAKGWNVNALLLANPMLLL